MLQYCFPANARVQEAKLAQERGDENSRQGDRQNCSSEQYHPVPCQAPLRAAWCRGAYTTAGIYCGAGAAAWPLATNAQHSRLAAAARYALPLAWSRAAKVAVSMEQRRQCGGRVTARRFFTLLESALADRKVHRSQL